MNIALIQHPTVALKLHGHQDAPDGMWLSQIYRRVMPVSLARVASVAREHLDADVSIVDLRSLSPDKEIKYRQMDWEGYELEAYRIGAEFEEANDAIKRADIVGFSSHFTYESGVVADLIAHAKKVNPNTKVMVGGADAKARPKFYHHCGADLVFQGDFDPQALGDDSLESRIIAPYSFPFGELTLPAFDLFDHLDCYTDSHDGQVPEGVSTPVGFIYFTRGCPRECDFCESRLSSPESLDFDAAITMLKHYKDAGITTLNLADDNLLLAFRNRRTKADYVDLFHTMREMGFAWEFPNGLEIGLLVGRDGRLDEEVMHALFDHRNDGERHVGAYRLYVPVENFDRRENYKKLKPLEVQNKVISWLSANDFPELDFGVMIPPNADHATFNGIEEGYRRIQEVVGTSRTRARYAVFHTIPISLLRGRIRTKYTVQEFPEGWHFSLPVYDGEHLTARQLFDERLAVTKRIDPGNYEGLMRGTYTYT